MDADSKDKEDEDSATKQILEYYRKYSQSRELPKYFSGTSVAYLPEIVDEEDDEKPTQSNVKMYAKIAAATEEKQYKQPNQDHELSPTGSLASNRKLEWDNLGDIGYSNLKKVHKSASLPILTQDKNVESDTQLKSTSAASSNVKIVIFPYTSSSEERSSGKHTLDSSSSSPGAEHHDLPTSSATTNDSEKQKLLSYYSDSSSNSKVVGFTQSLNYLKKKIGVPDAQSTPNDSVSTKDNLEKISDTPVVKKSVKTVKRLVQELDLPEKEAHKELDIALTSKKKVINLCLTKPLLLDCLSKSNVKQLTIGIQTDNISKSKTPLKSHELVTLYKHSDAGSDSAKSSSSNAIASKCDSFEYVKNINDQEHSASVAVEVDNSPVGKLEENKNEIEENKNENSKFEEDNTNSEKSEASQNLPETDPRTISNDVERNIYILQRLIKSKKYDSSTKKKYIKKILQKITESKYLEDSSTSSELFYPKIDPSKVLQDQRKYSSFKNEKSSSSYQSHEEKKSSPRKNKSESTESDISYLKERKAGPSKLEAKPSTSKPENKPSSLFIPRKEIKMCQKKKATASENVLPKETSFETKPLDSKDKETKKTPFTVTKCQELSSSDKSSSPQSYQNWRELKTVSEKVFENNGKSCGGGDQLTQFADKERQYQLNWIDREINHLGKLKCLLEKKRNPYPAPERLKKTTSVYMVAASNNKDVIKRNYVIETKLGVGRSQQRNFRLNGEHYIVQDPNHQVENSEESQPIVADIQVLSTDKTTNIRVTTFCTVCKRAPCVCVTDFLEGLSNPFGVGSNVVKEHLNDKNQPFSCSCSCNSTSNSSTSSKESAKTICVVCHRSPCTCCACKKPHDLKTCSVCQLYSCMCFISPKGSTVSLDPYVGAFIPTTKPAPISEKPERKTCKCGICPCICELFSSSSSSTDKKESSRTSARTTTNSLTKVFVDCKCDASRACSCKFVDKLLKHFNKEECSKNEETEKQSHTREQDVPAVYKTVENIDVATQNQIAVGYKVLQTELAELEDKNVQKEIVTNSNFSQTDTQVCPSVAVETEKICNIDKIVLAGIQNEATITCEDTAVVTDKIGSVQSCDKATEMESRKSSGYVADQCIHPKSNGTQSYLYTEEKTSPRELPLTVDKSSGHTIEEYEVTSNHHSLNSATREYLANIFAAEKRTLHNSKRSSADKSTSSALCEVDKGSGAISKRPSVDKSTSSGVCEVDKGTDAISKRASVDQSTSISCEVDKGTDAKLRRVSVDQFTSPRTSEVGKGNDASSKKTSVDMGTSPITFKLEIGSDPTYKRTSVDQATSPRIFEIDKETNSTPRRSADHSFSVRTSEIEKGIDRNVRKSVDEDNFAEPEKVAAEDAGSFSDSKKSSQRRSSVNKEIGIDASKISERRSNETSLSEHKLTKVRNSEKTTITSSEIAVGCDYEQDRTLVVSIGHVPMSGDYNEASIVTTDTIPSSKVNNYETEKVEATTVTTYTKPSKVNKHETGTAEDSKKQIRSFNEGTMTKPEIIKMSTVYKPKKPADKDKTKERASVDVQTDLLSKDIQSIKTSVCMCFPPTGSEKIRKKKCICCNNEVLKKKSKNHIICVYAPVDSSQKSHRSKVMCLNEACEKKSRRNHKRRSSYCSSCKRCRVASASKSLHSDSKIKCKCFCPCQCRIMKSGTYCCSQKNCTETSASTTPKVKSPSTNESPTESLFTNSSSSDGTCCCCGNRVALEGISLLRSNDQEFPVCKECLEKRPVLTTVCFAGPDGDSSQTSSRSNTAADHFRRCESYCTCKRGTKTKKVEYCPHCRNQLKRTQKSRNGIAYTLTLEDETPEKSKIRTKRKLKKLEEIKIKVPNPYNRKQYKNRENNYRKDEDRMKRLESGEDSEIEENPYSTNINTKKTTDHNEAMNNKENNEYYTLQEYLRKNRPGFVDAAEYRRLALINSKVERELNKDDLKLKFLEQNVHNNRLKRQKLFSEQEMREITKRNYKKLPEVQQKLIDQRQQKLRSADKFMADMLKRKIQNCVLKGKRSFPIDTNVINVYK